MRKTDKGKTDNKIMKILGEIIHKVSHLIWNICQSWATDLHLRFPVTTLNVFTIVYLIHSVLKIKTNWLFKRNKHFLNGNSADIFLGALGKFSITFDHNPAVHITGFFGVAACLTLLLHSGLFLVVFSDNDDILNSSCSCFLTSLFSALFFCSSADIPLLVCLLLIFSFRL